MTGRTPWPPWSESPNPYLRGFEDGKLAALNEIEAHMAEMESFMSEHPGLRDGMVGTAAVGALKVAHKRITESVPKVKQ